MYKSHDGSIYHKLADVAPNESRVGLNQYTYIDKTEIENTYYKIKIIDHNGQFTWTNVIKAKGNETAISNLVYPIPAGNMVNIQYNSEEISDAIITVKDAFGKVIKTENQGILGTGDFITLDISTFSNGVYFVSITGGNELSKPTKFIKQ